MRITMAVYALLYVVVEMLVHQLESAAWPPLSPLLVATAVTDALLVASVLLAVVVGVDITRRHWQPPLHTWLHRHATPHGDWWDHSTPFEARSWRAPALALPAGER